MELLCVRLYPTIGKLFFSFSHLILFAHYSLLYPAAAMKGFSGGKLG